jgi:hypothetical protein
MFVPSRFACIVSARTNALDIGSSAETALVGNRNLKAEPKGTMLKNEFGESERMKSWWLDSIAVHQAAAVDDEDKFVVLRIPSAELCLPASHRRSGPCNRSLAKEVLIVSLLRSAPIPTVSR